MNSVKQHWFRFSLIGLAVLVGLYYLLIFFPNKEITAKVDNCRRVGEEYRKNEIRENPDLSFNTPKYSYNKSLDTCLYDGGHSWANSAGRMLRTRYIIDLNTNEVIIESTYIGSEKLEGVDRIEFGLKEKELFGE